MDSKTIKIRKGNAHTLNFSTDNKDDDVDICIYENGEKCMTIKSHKKIEGEGECEHCIRIGEEESDELGEGTYEYSARVNGEEFEDGEINIYTNAKNSKKD